MGDSWGRLQAERRVFEAARAALAYEDAPTGDEIVDEQINMQAWYANRDAALRELAEAVAALEPAPQPEEETQTDDG